jgi:hypothetical protein
VLNSSRLSTAFKRKRKQDSSDLFAVTIVTYPVVGYRAHQGNSVAANAYVGNLEMVGTHRNVFCPQCSTINERVAAKLEPTIDS